MYHYFACSTNDLFFFFFFHFFFVLKRDKTKNTHRQKKLSKGFYVLGGSPKQKKALIINFSSHHQLNFLHNNILNTSSRTIRTPGRYGVERRRKEREESEERKAWGQTTGGEWRRRGFVEEAGSRRVIGTVHAWGRGGGHQAQSGVRDCLAVGRWEVNQEGVESREKRYARAFFLRATTRREKKTIFF